MTSRRLHGALGLMKDLFVHFSIQTTRIPCVEIASTGIDLPEADAATPPAYASQFDRIPLKIAFAGGFGLAGPGFFILILLLKDAEELFELLHSLYYTRKNSSNLHRYLPAAFGLVRSIVTNP